MLAAPLHCVQCRGFKSSNWSFDIRSTLASSYSHSKIGGLNLLVYVYIFTGLFAYIQYGYLDGCSSMAYLRLSLRGLPNLCRKHKVLVESYILLTMKDQLQSHMHDGHSEMLEVDVVFLKNISRINFSNNDNPEFIILWTIYSFYNLNYLLSCIYMYVRIRIYTFVHIAAHWTYNELSISCMLNLTPSNLKYLTYCNIERTNKYVCVFYLSHTKPLLKKYKTKTIVNVCTETSFDRYFWLISVIL